MIYKFFAFGEMTVVYGIEGGTATVTVIPSDMCGKLCEEKMNGIDPFGQKRIEPSMQFAVEGDSYSRDFSAGKTHRNKGLSFRFGVPAFTYEEGETVRLTAEYTSPEGIVARQVFTSVRGANVISTYMEAENRTGGKIVAESAPSFMFGRLSPFVKYNDEADLLVHTMRSYWSAEGTLVSQPPSYYGLEDSWSGLGVRMEKIGRLGTMPAEGHLPWAAVEDRTNDCTWAVKIEAPMSWQIEIANVYNGISLCGGLADATFGHWKKQMEAGEIFRTRRAFITACHGGVERAAHNLVRASEISEAYLPSEEEMPVIYNEYCYTWGRPSLDIAKTLLPVCRELGIKYFVTDAGWYRDDERDWNSLGDWLANEKYFPGGLGEYARACRDHGMRAGVWFEFESVSLDSEIAREHPELLLTLDGKTIVHGNRAMLDFRKAETRAYLEERVIGLLLATGIRYIKIDYNENVGMGVDGAESPCEGLRQHTDAVLAFYRELKEKVPDLVVEMCSSGGMRHEPLWLSLGSMCSFSDAHEGPEGAVVACDLHRFISPRKLQIWATIRDDYDENDTYFTVAKSMLGRMCLSGNLAGRTENICRAIREGVAFYAKIKDVVKSGETIKIARENITYLRNIHGVQTLTRLSEDGTKLLWYCFVIGKPGAQVQTRVPKGFVLTDHYGNAKVRQEGNAIGLTAAKADMVGCVALLEKK